MDDAHLTFHTIPIEISAEYAVARPQIGHSRDSQPDPPLLLVFHGWGQTCRSIVRRFASMGKRGILVVAPQAPHPFYVSMDPKKVGFSWLTQHERDRAIEEFAAYMRRLLARLEQEERYDESRLFVAGYSQGVSMAYRLVVRDILKPAGVVACNSDLPKDVAVMLPAIARFPVLLVHGEADPLVPLSKRDQAAQTLTEQGFVVDHWTHAGGHELPRSAVEHIGDWILSHCDKS